jgi:hypothetical protein
MDRSLIVGDAGGSKAENSLYPSAATVFEAPPWSSGESYPSRDLSYLPTYDAGEKRPLNRSSSYLSFKSILWKCSEAIDQIPYDPEGQVMLLRLLLNLLVRSLEKKRERKRWLCKDLISH